MSFRLFRKALPVHTLVDTVRVSTSVGTTTSTFEVNIEVDDWVSGVVRRVECVMELQYILVVSYNLLEVSYYL